ncbi:MAG: RAMP superfamily CRISPR-associated protein, partial [Candidatus Sumerlaeia bacterium]|nr:RAMP superfamily CRISPR-associated protein [Candidatus Sumerlaeia bacterium]
MRLKSHLAVLSDNAFAFSTRFATEVMARIKLNPETKTVEGGALFYQEFLPAGTLLNALAIAEAPFGKKEDREKAELKSAQGVLKYVTTALDKTSNVIQVGGDASIGKGLCTAKLIQSQGVN